MEETPTTETTETAAFVKDEADMTFRDYMNQDIAAGDISGDTPYPRAKAYTKAAALALLERDGATGVFMMSIAMWLAVVEEIVRQHPLRLPIVGGTIPPPQVVATIIDALKTIDPQLQKVTDPKQWFSMDEFVETMTKTPGAELERFGRETVAKHGPNAAILLVGTLLSAAIDYCTSFTNPIAKLLIARVGEGLKDPLTQLATLIVKFTNEESNKANKPSE